MVKRSLWSSSGCGRPTSSRMLAGLEPVDEGDILIDDRSVLGVSPQKRDIAMVFQNYEPDPHTTVRQNLGFALETAKLSRLRSRGECWRWRGRSD